MQNTPPLALFDLDHTLIPFDSGMAWTRFLVGRGVLPTAAPEAYLAACRGYVDGQLDIRALHRATVLPLAALDAPALDVLAGEFETAVAPRLPEQMLALVRGHRERGDVCALVTATARFIAEPLARLFGLPHVLATTSARDAAGRFTGEIDGEPCFREHKISHVRAWLAQEGWAWPAEQCFYSDSINDLPLLEAVTRAVAVRPDPRLRAHAQQRGWTIIDPAS
ncbi:HAD family phosphatase [Pelomonas sp. KK5]|uniref:HAD family hydrolase n=1 Tax=Pelomonas sp. KK5 TaxID=1855730 RepID=UPI00097C998F|nr:HAD family phosphatase [Pelomonas sp. KK5]